MTVEFIVTENKTIASVLIAEGFHPFLENKDWGVYYFSYSEEIAKLLSERFDDCQYCVSDIVSF